MSQTPPADNLGVTIGPFAPTNTAAVIDLWRQCGLIAPGNDTEQDIARKQRVQPELFLVAEVAGQVIGSVMAGYEGHRGWTNYLATPRDAWGHGGLAAAPFRSALVTLPPPFLPSQCVRRPPLSAGYRWIVAIVAKVASRPATSSSVPRSTTSNSELVLGTLSATRN